MATTFQNLNKNVITCIHSKLNEKNAASFASSKKTVCDAFKDLNKRRLYVHMKNYLLTTYLINAKLKKKATYRRASEKHQTFVIKLAKFLEGYDLDQFSKILGLGTPSDFIRNLLTNVKSNIEFNIKYNIYRKKPKNTEPEYTAKMNVFDVIIRKPEDRQDQYVYLSINPEGLEADFEEIPEDEDIKWMAGFVHRMSALMLYVVSSIQNQDKAQLINADDSLNVKIQMLSVRNVLSDIRELLEHYASIEETEAVEANAALESTDPVRFFTENYVNSDGLLSHTMVEELITERKLAVALFVKSTIKCELGELEEGNKKVTFTLQDKSNIVITFSVDSTQMIVQNYVYISKDIAIKLSMVSKDFSCKGFANKQDFDNICNTLQLFFTGLASFKRQNNSSPGANNKQQYVNNVQSLPKINKDQETKVASNIKEFRDKFISIIHCGYEQIRKEFLPQAGGTKKK